MSIAAAREFIEEMASVSELRRGSWVQLGIAEVTTNALLGDIGLYLAPDELTAEIGFTLRRDSQGVGHATRAVQASLSLAFAASPAKVVRAVTDARNARSIRVLERTGFARSCVRQTVFKGEPCTEVVYVYNPADGCGSRMSRQFSARCSRHSHEGTEECVVLAETVRIGEVEPCLEDYLFTTAGEEQVVFAVSDPSIDLCVFAKKHSAC